MQHRRAGGRGAGPKTGCEKALWHNKSVGGQGKAIVADGHVRVDGEIELRKTAKIRKGQVVECFDNKITVILTESLV